MAEMVTTDSGLRVVVETIPGSAVTSIGIWVKVGSRHENDSRESHSRGIAHLTEHMVCRGGFSTTSAEMSEQVGLMGGDSNAETERDFTAYWSMSVGGSREKFLRSAGKEIVIPFWWKHYSPNRTTVVVVGDVDIQDVQSIVEGKLSEHADRFSNPVCPRTQRVEYPSRKGIDYVDVSSRPGRTYIYHGVRGVPFSHPLYYPVVVLSSALGDGHNSRVNRVIRQKLGLAYSATSSHYSFADDGMFVLEVSSDNLASAKMSMEIMHDELDKLAYAPLDQSELEATKRSLANEIMLDNDGTFQIMYRLGYGMTAAGWERPVSVNEIAERIMSVTAEQVQEAAKLISNGLWSRVEFTEERDDYQ